MAATALGDVFAWYTFAYRLLSGIQRSLTRNPDDLLALVWPREWDLEPVERVQEGLRRTLQELDDYTVLALFSAFEGWLLQDFEERCDEMARRAKGLEQRVLRRGKRELQWGKLTDILDVYKAVVPTDLVGQVKQVKEYRDWVAHGRWGRPSANVWPRAGYDRLRDFINCAGPAMEVV